VFAAGCVLHLWHVPPRRCTAASSSPLLQLQPGFIVSAHTSRTVQTRARPECRHAHQVVLKDLPQHFHSFTLSSAASTEEDMIPAPDITRTVMMRPAEESTRIAISAENECVVDIPWI
jgi:hypothetical protein